MYFFKFKYREDALLIVTKTYYRIVEIELYQFLARRVIFISRAPVILPPLQSYIFAFLVFLCRM